jgi:hypothetical protein
MEGSHFDTAVRALAVVFSRRGALGVTLGSLGGGPRSVRDQRNEETGKVQELRSLWQVQEGPMQAEARRD